MKKLTAVTTALAMAIALAPSYAFAAADGGQSECTYPAEFISELNFTALADYAINGDTRAYAESTKLYIIAPDEYGDEYLTTADCGFQITDIEYDGEGNLYLKSTDNAVYSYPGLTSAQFEFTTINEPVVNGYRYVLTDKNGLLAYNTSTPNPTNIFEEGCTHLKVYDNVAYVMNNGNVYSLDGLQANILPAEYTDFTSANNISTANAAEILASSYTVRTVTVRPQTSDGHDTYVTKINLENIGATFDAQGTERITGDRSALAIAEVGNATIIVMRDENGLNQSYITLTAAVENSDYSPPENDMQSACAREGLTIYSRPYMCGATAVATVDGGTVFTVTEKFERQYLNDVYYRVTCTVDGQEISGFVASNMLSPYNFSAENEQENSTGTDDFTYDNNVQTVIIVLLIVLLVLIAAGYVIFYLTRKGDGKTRRRKNKPSDNEDLYT